MLSRVFILILLQFSFCLTQLFGQGLRLGFSLAEGKKRVEIPFELYNNLVVVQVRVNGMLPLKFIVDTGVRTTILTQKAYTDFLNLTYSRKYTIAGPGGVNLVEAYITNGVDLSLNGVDGHGHALLVLENDYLQLRNYLGAEVHGILGYELFSRFIVKVNYERKIMTLMTPERLHFGKRYETIKMPIEDTKPYIYTDVVQSNGQKTRLKFLVDSGASHGLLLDPQSDSAIVVPSNATSCVVGRGLGGEIRGKTGRLNSLQLGRFILPHAIVNYPDPNSYIDTLKLDQTFRNGSIGGEILQRFTVIYDFSAQEMHLKKNANFKKGFYYNFSGITLSAKGIRLNQFQITDIRLNSASEQAGLQIGDEIIKVNGQRAEAMTLNQVNQYLNQRAGKKVTLIVKRRNTLITAKMILQNTL